MISSCIEWMHTGTDTYKDFQSWCLGCALEIIVCCDTKRVLYILEEARETSFSLLMVPYHM